MNPEEIRSRISPGEIQFSASRSGGPGGQNVNKVNTKVELRFNVEASGSLTDAEKEIILLKLKSKINAAGELLIVSQSERSQLLNRNRAEEKFFILLAKTLTPEAPRKKSVPTSASRLKRLEGKRIRGNIKKLRAGLTDNET